MSQPSVGRIIDLNARPASPTLDGVTLAPPADLSQAIAPLTDIPPSPVVTDAATYTAALEYVRDGRRRCDEIAKIVEPVKTPAYKAWKAICDLEKRAIDRIKAVCDPLERGAVAWKSEQDALAERERQRQLAEAKAAEDARMAAEAAALEAAGLQDEAEAVLAQAIEQPAPVFVPPPMPVAPKVEGMTMVDVWCFEITTPALVPDEYKVIDESRIRKVVETFKGTKAIPGVRQWKESRPRRTGGRK